MDAGGTIMLEHTLAHLHSPAVRGRANTAHHSCTRTAPHDRGTRALLHSAAAAVHLPRTHTEADDPAGSVEPGLSQEEAAFFKQNGFLVKRRLIPAATLAPFAKAFMSSHLVHNAPAQRPHSLHECGHMAQENYN